MAIFVAVLTFYALDSKVEKTAAGRGADHQSLPGTNSIRVSEGIDDTSLLTDASLRVAKDALSLELGFIHEYNDNYTAMSGSLTFRCAF